jgi:hypothetical protein
MPGFSAMKSFSITVARRGIGTDASTRTSARQIVPVPAPETAVIESIERTPVSPAASSTNMFALMLRLSEADATVVMFGVVPVLPSWSVYVSVNTLLAAESVLDTYAQI